MNSRHQNIPNALFMLTHDQEYDKGGFGYVALPTLRKIKHTIRKEVKGKIDSYLKPLQKSSLIISEGNDIDEPIKKI